MLGWSKLDAEDEEPNEVEIVKQLEETKTFFAYLPFWYVNMQDEKSSIALNLRIKLEIDIKVAKSVC